MQIIRRAVFLFCFIAIAIATVVTPLQASTSKINPIDLRNAQLYVQKLPHSCKKKVAAQNDGTVVVTYSCRQDGKKTSGHVYMKNGRVIGLR